MLLDMNDRLLLEKVMLTQAEARIENALVECYSEHESRILRYRRAQVDGHSGRDDYPENEYEDPEYFFRQYELKYFRK